MGVIMSINDYRDRGDRVYAEQPQQTTLGAGRNAPQYAREDYPRNPVEVTQVYTAFDALNASDILIGALSEKIDMLAKVIDSVLEENYPQNKQCEATRAGNTPLISRINHQADALENFNRVLANLIDRVRL